MSESRTHADGVIGHIVVGSQGKADLSLLLDASQLVVLEAKMFSRLSSGTKNAPYFDQAARNVAAIAETLKQADLHPSVFSQLGFYVLAPQDQLVHDDFAQKVNRVSVRQKVEKRVSGYVGEDCAEEKRDWYKNWFLPTWQKIEISTMSWESILAAISQYDRLSVSSLEEFYTKCIRLK